MRPFEPQTVEPKNLPAALRELLQRGGRPRFAYAWRTGEDQIELRYIVSEPGVQRFHRLAL